MIIIQWTSYAIWISNDFIQISNFHLLALLLIKEDKNASNPIEKFLLNYLEGSQFIVYDFYFNSETPENIDSSLNNLNCIICIEKNCLLIEKSAYQ